MNQEIESVTKPKKNMRYYMRFLHNNIGFLIVGLVIMYSLSGIVQIYRDTDFLKHEVMNEKKLPPNLETSQLKEALRMRNLEVQKKEGGIIYFEKGSYNSVTGLAKYTTKEWYSFILPFTELHKSSTRDGAHYFTTVFGVLLLFMSISAFWMFKPGTKLFSRAVVMTMIGLLASLIILMI